MDVFICQACGHIEFNSAPDSCPVCGAPKEQYKQHNNIFTESEEKSSEASVKHIPSVTIEKKCGLIPEEGCVDAFIRVGQTLHPMQESHYIQFIDCYIDDSYIERIYLSPKGVHPAGCIHLKVDRGRLTTVERCNIHGYWKTDTVI